VDIIGISHSLYLLPAGPKVGSAHAVLGSKAAAHLIGGLRRSFRYILIDSSAVFGSAETLAWHGMIDRYIMVARRGVSDTDDLGRAADRLNRDKILGVTFVGAPARSVVA
jgi:Mrp family chromosome partitioning ATPase